MTGHFEKGKWIEEIGFTIQQPDNLPLREQVQRVANILNLESNSYSPISLEALDGNWYSFFDIVEGMLKRVK